MARSKLLLEAHLKALRLPTFLREYDKLARQCAAESLDSRSFLQQLCELELLDREPSCPIQDEPGGDLGKVD